MRNSQPTSRSKGGAVLAESAAAMALFLPLVILITFVALEVSYAYLLKSSLSEGAREAARDLAIAYGIDSSIMGDRSKENQKAFDKIRIYNIVNSSSQFDEPVWHVSSTDDPKTVTVTVRYLSDQYGLPHFPNPDPLRLGSNFQITGTSTYRVQ